MVLRKRLTSQVSQPSTAFVESKLYKIITSSSVDFAASLSRQALYVDDEPANIICSESGYSYLHVIAENYEMFTDPRALPVVYQLCYAGADVSAQDKVAGNTALHILASKPKAYPIIIALLRYGIDVTLRNSDNKTAEELMESLNTDASLENLHWYRKLAPGLLCCLEKRDQADVIDMEVIDRLLKGWCKVFICVAGKPINLLQIAQMRAKDVLLAETLKKYIWTNEFVHATLAGLPDQMRMHYKEARRKIDLDTKDHSYQLNLQTPEVPQPLIAAAWEQNNFEVVDYLISVGVDVCNTYSNQPAEINKPKPLFYQTLMGVPRINDLNIMLRILENGDLRCKTEYSTTFLHESVKHDLPPQFVEKIIALGVALEEREEDGYTARDMAAMKGNTSLVRAIDSVVLDAVKNGDMKFLENLCVQCYDLQAVRDESGSTMLELATAGKLSSKMNKFFTKGIPEYQADMKKLWNSVDRNDIATLKKYLTNKDKKRVVFSRDRCGRTILLMAILNKNIPMIKLILKKQKRLIEYFDNRMLTCLHYANLVFEDDFTMSDYLQSLGASPDWSCTLGNRASRFKKGVMSDKDFFHIKGLVVGYGLHVFSQKTTFEPTLIEAIKSGDLARIEHLVDSVREYGSIKLFSHVVFDAIDARQEDVALYLLDQGCDLTITKQYETCSADNELCMMMECFHPTSTLLDRAKHQNLPRLVEYLMKTPLPEHNGNTILHDDNDMMYDGNGVDEDMDTTECPYINESFVTRM